MTTFEIEVMERRVRKGMVPSLFLAPGVQDGTPDVDGWYGRMVGPNGSTFEVSQLDGESTWTVDALWAANGMPIHANGFGARYLLTQRVDDEEIVAKLERAAK